MCIRDRYNFSQSKAEEIYGKAKELIPVLPKDDITKLIIKQAVDQLNSASTTAVSYTHLDVYKRQLQRRKNEMTHLIKLELKKFGIAQNIIFMFAAYKSSYMASMDAMKGLTSAIVSTSLVFMGVFIPVSFMSGTSGTFLSLIHI